MTNHTSPLKPGEIRRYATRGGKAFQVMHVSQGAFTQAKGPDGVICTLMGEDAALMTYAEAIADAEALEMREQDTVVRRGEEDGPRGIIKAVYEFNEYGRPAGAVALVSFEGGAPLAVNARNLALAPERPADETTDAMLAEDLARPLRDAVRRYVPGGGSQFLDELVARAEDASAILEQIRDLADAADARRESESRYDREGCILQDLIKGLRNIAGYKP